MSSNKKLFKKFSRYVTFSHVKVREQRNTYVWMDKLISLNTDQLTKEQPDPCRDSHLLGESLQLKQAEGSCHWVWQFRGHRRHWSRQSPLPWQCPIRRQWAGLRFTRSRCTMWAQVHTSFSELPENFPSLIWPEFQHFADLNHSLAKETQLPLW